MLPEKWGKCAWKFLHSVTLDYPMNPTPTDKEHYRQFFNLLQYTLPCGKCRHNLGNHLKKYPLTPLVLSNRNNLIKWLINLHNIVNYYTGKPMLNQQEAFHELNKLSQPKRKSNWPYYFLFIIIILIVGYFIYRYLSQNKKLNY